jgi:hypothetical protein
VKRIVLAAALFLAPSLAGCSQPARQCVTQLDCFGGEACVDGSCIIVIEIGNEGDTSQFDVSSTDVGSPGDATGRDTSTAADDLGCVPQCGVAACGLDPVCALSCGSCQTSQTCEAGTCVEAAAMTRWTLDGDVVNTSTSVEALYTASQDHMFVGIPLNGRNIQLSLADVSNRSSISYSCADEPITFGPLSLITSDNGWADLDALPARWKGLILNGSHCINPGDDELAMWSLEITTLDPGRVAGSVTIELAGGGPRSGETLHIASEFDVEATSM